MPCLNSQLRKFQNYIFYRYVITDKHSLQLKQISIVKISKIYLCMKIKQNNKIVLIWQPSWMPYCIKALLLLFTKTRSHFGPFFAWNNLNLMQ